MYNNTRIPMTSQTISLYKLCGGVQNLDRMALSDDCSQIKVSECGVEFRTNKTTIKSPNPSGVVGSECRLQQVMVFTLCKIRDELLKGGRIEKDTLTFELSELVDNDIFYDYSTAKRSFEEIARFIKGISISTKDSASSSLFNGFARTHRGTVKVEINNHINWKKLIDQYIGSSTIVFSLPNMPFKLVMAVLERIRVEKYSKPFDMSLAYAMSRLNLPSKSNKAERDVKKPLREAIRIINENSEALGFKIVPNYDESLKLPAMIKNGRLTVVRPIKNHSSKSPKNPGYIYKLMDKNENLLYIGKTKNINTRLYQHHNVGHLPNECYQRAEWIDVCELPTYADAGILERYLIGTYEPEYNKQYTAEGTPTIGIDTSKLSWSRQQF